MKKVAVIRGDDILEYPSNRKVVAVKSGDVLEYPTNRRVAKVGDIAKQIRDARGSATLVAMWWFFVR
jgi:hypothetical protein